MNYIRSGNWITRELLSLERLTPIVIIYIIFKTDGLLKLFTTAENKKEAF